MAQTAVSAQVEEYLEAMCRIRDRGDLTTLTALARELRVAPPSVLGMIHRMVEQELVMYTRRTGAVLTAHGQLVASRLRRRHRLAERLLTDLLAIPWARAHEIACRFEHVIDEEVEPYLLAALDHPTTCPHGNPLNGDGDETLCPLSELAVGQAGRVLCILDESAPLLEYLTELHLQPDAWVVVHAAAPFGGPLTLDVAGERVALAREVAQHLLVAPEVGR